MTFPNGERREAEWRDNNRNGPGMTLYGNGDRYTGEYRDDQMSGHGVLAFASGFTGWAIAFGLSSLLKLAPMPDMFPGLPVSAFTSAVAFGALSVIAVLSALIPAWHAASLTPVEALRYER